MDMQEQMENFVDKWAPEAERSAFVDDLRTVMNQYARAAIAHGDVPEKGVPHKS